jgi:hypothetical protein
LKKVKNLNPFGFAIMTYVRIDYLRDRINEIKKFHPEIPIVVGIDAYIGDNEKFKQNNLELSKYCTELLNQQIIRDFYINDNNIGAKSNWHKLMDFSFQYFENVIYLEDDVSLTGTLDTFLSDYVNSQESKRHHQIGSLQPNFPHNNKHPAKNEKNFIYSKWLNSWGIVISSELYKQLFEYIETEVDLSIREHLSSAYYRKRNNRIFTRTWKFKFEKAIKSKTAWDTELMLKLWEKNITVLLPNFGLTKDLGIDDSSISSLKNMKIDFPSHALKLGGTSEKFCLNCEKGRYYKELYNFKYRTSFGKKLIKLRVASSQFSFKGGP